MSSEIQKQTEQKQINKEEITQTQEFQLGKVYNVKAAPYPPTRMVCEGFINNQLAFLASPSCTLTTELLSFRDAPDRIVCREGITFLSLDWKINFYAKTSQEYSQKLKLLEALK